MCIAANTGQNIAQAHLYLLAASATTVQNAK